MMQPESVAGMMDRDPMFSHHEDGKIVSRKAKCECGRAFTQRLLSERFLMIVEAHSRRAIELTTKQIPGFFVPVHCPSCERMDLGMQARRDQYAQQPNPPFGERDAA